MKEHELKWMDKLRKLIGKKDTYILLNGRLGYWGVIESVSNDGFVRMLHGSVGTKSMLTFRVSELRALDVPVEES
jgi:hypothetical protein